MYCSKCGADVKKEDKFCPCCGAELENNITEEANEDVYGTSEPSFESGTTVQEGPSRRDGIATGALIVACISIVIPPLFLIAIILGLIGLRSNRKPAAIVGLIIGGFSAISTLVLFGVILPTAINLLKNNSNSESKRNAEKKAQEVFTVARNILLEAEFEEDTLGGYVSISGTEYYVTVTDLISHGDLAATPFKDCSYDGGMTIYHDKYKSEYRCDISGTIDGYTLTFDGHFFKAK